MALRKVDPSEVENKEVEGMKRVGHVDEGGKGWLETAGGIAREINIGIGSALGVSNFTEGDPSVGDMALRGVGAAAGGTAVMYAAAPGALARTTTRGLSIAQQSLRAHNALSSARTLGPATDRFLTSALDTAAQSPTRFMLTELGAGASSGAVGEIAEEMTGSEDARRVGELAGGTAVAVGSPVVTGAMKASMMAQAARVAVRRMVKGKATTQGMTRAAQRAQSAAGDVRATIAKADAADVLDAPLTLGERAESPGLLALERSIADSSDDLSAAHAERLADINRIIRAEITGTEPAEVSAAEARVYLDALLAERTRIAALKADERIAKLAPRTVREQTNRIVKEELEGAYNAARAQEQQLWGAVDSSVVVRPEKSTAAIQGLYGETEGDRVAQTLEIIPKRARQWLGTVKDGEFSPGEFGDSATVGEMQSLRSALLDQARKERAKKAPNRRKIRALTILSDALLEDLGGVDDEAIKVARGFSADLNARFRQGNVGMILGYEVTGEAGVAPILTLEKTIAKSGMDAAKAVDDLIAANPGVQGNLEDFISDEFLRASTKGGDFDATQAANYLNRRQDVLSRFPELEAKFRGAIDAQDASNIAAQAANSSPASLILKAPVGKEVDRIISSPDPAGATRAIMGELADPTAKASFRKGVVEWILNKASTSTTDALDQDFVSGRRLSDTLNDPAVSKVIREALTIQQQAHLKRAMNTALRLDQARKARPSKEGVISDATGTILEIVRHIAAAGVGRNVARQMNMGGTVQIPGKFVQLSNKLVEIGLDPAKALLIDAVTSSDDSLLRALLMEPVRPSQKLWARRQLNAWVFATAERYGIDLSGSVTTDVPTDIAPPAAP